MSQACTFKPEQVSARKAARGRALLMSGAAAADSPARSSRFSAVAAMDDLDKYEVSALPSLLLSSYKWYTLIGSDWLQDHTYKATQQCNDGKTAALMSHII